LLSEAALLREEHAGQSVGIVGRRKLLQILLRTRCMPGLPPQQSGRFLRT
jgi:hypothetical protein